MRKELDWSSNLTNGLRISRRINLENFNNRVFEYRCFNNEIEYLIYKDPNYEWVNCIKYLFDRSDSTLNISGDLGCAVFCWDSSRNTLRDIAKYSKSLGYFASKARAAEELWNYDYGLLDEQLNDYLELSDENDDCYLSKSERQELKELLLENWDERSGYHMNSDLEGKLADFDPDYWENLPDGKVISDWIKAYAYGLQKWLEQD